MGILNNGRHLPGPGQRAPEGPFPLTHGARLQTRARDWFAAVPGTAAIPPPPNANRRRHKNTNWWLLTELIIYTHVHSITQL